MKKLILGFLVLMASGAAVANDDISNLTVIGVGCQAPINCYVYMTPNPDNCLNGVVYINMADSVGIGKAMYATAMMAKANGRTVRLSYTQTAVGQACSANIVQAN